MSKKTENVDYQLVPIEGDKDAWGVRILKGDFIETVISYVAVSFNEVKDHMSFNFDVISSPYDLATTDNEELQVLAGEILTDIIEVGIQEETVEFIDKNSE